MSITAEEVKKLASLSRISLSEEEVAEMQEEMSSILGYIERINSASADAVEEQLSEHRNVWREDVVTNTPGEYTESLLANAPARDGDYVKVKNIL